MTDEAEVKRKDGGRYWLAKEIQQELIRAYAAKGEFGVIEKDYAEIASLAIKHADAMLAALSTSSDK